MTPRSAVLLGASGLVGGHLLRVLRARALRTWRNPTPFLETRIQEKYHGTTSDLHASIASFDGGFFG